jgi:atypical dual specificity phosphatase
MPPTKKARKSASSSAQDTASLILDPFLYLGPQSAATSLPFLTAKAITHIISVGCPNVPTPEHFKNPSKTHLKLPLNDKSSGVSIRDTVSQGVEFIREAVASNPNAKVLVHCKAGISRSSTVVTAYLMQEQRMSLRASLALIIQKREQAYPNPGFLEQLKELEMELFGLEAATVSVAKLPLSRAEKLKLFQEDNVESSGGPGVSEREETTAGPR